MCLIKPTFLMQLRPNDKILSCFIPARGMIRSMQFVDKDNCLPCGTGDAPRIRTGSAGKKKGEQNNQHAREACCQTSHRRFTKKVLYARRYCTQVDYSSRPPLQGNDTRSVRYNSAIASSAHSQFLSVLRELSSLAIGGI